MKTIRLSAEAKFGFGGKEYIARITGRDAKFTFARKFIGHKEGKRKETAIAIVDEPGLYVEVDITRRGDKEETYKLVWEAPDGELYVLIESVEEAMIIAKRLDAGESINVIGRAERVETWRAYNVEDGSLDPEESVEVSKSDTSLSVLGGIPLGHHPRRDVIAARKRAMARLSGASEEEAEELHASPPKSSP